MKRKTKIENSEKILLVDDNEVNQELAAEMLKLMGYAVDVAHDGEQALQALDRRDYQLVLMDCEMPVMNGYVATRLWRQRERETQRRPIPVIAITASEKVRCLEAGMNDFLTKPFDYETFSQTIHYWLNGKKAGAKNLTENAENNEARAEADKESQEHVLDQTQLDLLRNWRGQPNPELTEKVMRLCLAQITQLRTDIFEAAQQGDVIATAGMAHTLKSSSGTVGAMRLMSLCQKIETLYETTGTIEMDLVTRIGQACADAEVALNQELELLA